MQASDLEILVSSLLTEILELKEEVATLKLQRETELKLRAGANPYMQSLQPQGTVFATQPTSSTTGLSANSIAAAGAGLFGGVFGK